MIAYSFNSGVDPADFKNGSPIYRVKYYETPYTYKSEGISLYRYLITDSSEPDWDSLTNLNLVDSLTTNIVGFYNADGAILGFHNTDNFALHYDGYFYTDHPVSNNTYAFKIYGFGYIKIKINDTWVVGNDSSYIELKKLIPYIRSISLGAKQWYKIDIYYYSLLGENGFTVLWKNDYYNEYVPLSAGVLSKKGNYLSSKTISYVISADLSINNGEVSVFNFELPLTVSGSSDNGYYYNEFWDKYCHSNEDIALDKFKLVEFEVGYKHNGIEDYIKRFTGHIESFKADREKERLEVECVSFENLYKQTLNLNYPDLYDYWNAEYAGKSVSRTSPDGLGMPTTFDGWELTKVVKVLSIRSGIDSLLLLKKKLFLDTNNQVVSGTSLIEDAAPNSVILDTNINYGNSVVVNQDIGSIPDDEYILKSNFGENLFDYINRIVDVYGWQWGCNSYYDGAPYLMANNNPYKVYVADNSVGVDGYGNIIYSGDWTTKTDISAIKGKYVESNTAQDYLDFKFKGVRADLVIVGSNDSGNEATITDYDSAGPTLYVDDASGFSAGHKIVIETKGGEEVRTIDSISSNGLTLDSALTYTPWKDGYVRTATFSTELRRGTDWDTASQVEIGYYSCYYNNSMDKYVLTNTLLNKTNSSVDSKRFYYDGIDPNTSNNPVVLNIANNKTYDNYILRVKRLIDSQAGSTNYLRVNALLVYDRDADKIVETFYTGDSVVSGTVTSLAVEDSGVDLRNDVIVIGRRLGVEVPGSTSGRPLNPNNPSYRHIISRATDIASIGNPDARNYIGLHRQTILVAPEISSDDRANYWSISFLDRYRNPKRFPEFVTLGNPLVEIGDCVALYDEGKKTLKAYDKFWITGIEETYEKKKYLSAFTTTSYRPWESYSPKSELTLSEFDNKIIANLTIENSSEDSPYDPYSYDSSGTLIKIKYDLLVDAWVRIDIYPIERPSIKVATLLNPTGSDGPEGWQKQEIGKNYVATWDGVDFYGEWNKYAGYDKTLNIGKGYFVREDNITPGRKGKFFIKFTIIKRNVTTPIIIFSNDSDYLGDNGYIYTQRANTTSLDFDTSPNCRFKDNVGPIRPHVAFTDSRSFAGDNMAFKLTINDSTDNNWDKYSFRTKPRNQWWENYPGLGLSTDLERNLNNRKVQLKIIGHNMVIIAGTWNDRASYQVIPIWKDVYYDNKSFVNYNYDNIFERYVNPVLFGYSYDYTNFVSEQWINNVQNANGTIWMGWYIFVEVEAYDKSGRRCYVTSPGSKRDDANKYLDGYGAWMFWLDDMSPYAPIDSSYSYNTNSSGYYWGAFNLYRSGVKDGIKLAFSHSDGTDLINNASVGLGNRILLVRVWPKTDRYGNSWGY